MAEENELDPQTRLSRALWDDPETRPLMEDAVAKKFPKANIPGRQQRLEGQGILDSIKKEREEFRAEVDSERRRRDLETERDKARGLGITDSQMPEVE